VNESIKRRDKEGTEKNRCNRDKQIRRRLAGGFRDHWGIPGETRLFETPIVLSRAHKATLGGKKRGEKKIRGVGLPS